MKIIDEIRYKLESVGLKQTPQRIAVLQALYASKQHPTAEEIFKSVKKKFPSISFGTIYKALETFVDKKIILKVKTDSDSMRYDAFTDRHHHLYCIDTDRIEDFYDDELNQILENYLKNKKIDNFNLIDYRLQLNGVFETK